MVALAPQLPTRAWAPLRYHPVQAAFWHCRKRFIVLPAGRGSGKTELCKRKLIRSLIIPKPWPDPKYFYGGPTEKQAKRIIWQSLVNLTPKSWVKKIKEGELRIETVFGSSVQVFGLDAPQRVEGEQYDGCVIDESSDIKPRTYDLSIVPTLTHRNGWCVRTGVPKRFGVGATEYKKAYEDALSGKVPDSAAFTWPSADILSTEALLYARAKLDQRDYAEQFEAVWQATGGGIFYAFERTYNVRACSYNPRLEILVGSDFNVDPMCWLLAHDYGDRIEVFDELFIRNTNTPETLDVLWSKYGTHDSGFAFYGDASGQNRNTSTAETDYLLIANDRRFRKAGRSVNYLSGNPSVVNRYAATNSMICSADGNRRLFMDPRCEHLIWDLENRSYKQGTRIPDNSNKDAGHITDALGYLIYALYPPTLIADEEEMGSAVYSTR